jgi:hypothetical protein
MSNPATSWQATLFTPTDHVGYKQDVMSDVRAHATSETQFFIANPLRELYTKRAASLENIASFRNIVVEFDEGTQAAQRKLVDKSGLPFAMATSSGNKSVHFIVSSNFDNMEEYSYYARAIYHVLGGAPDPKCKNANRLTRVPDSLRPDTGRVQELLELRTSVPKLELLTWLMDHDYVRNRFAKFQKQEAEQAMQLALRKAQSETRTERLPIPRIYQDMVHDGINHPDASDRHSGLLKFGAWLTHNGYEDELEELLFRAADAMGIGHRSDASQIVAYFSHKRR